MSRPITGEYRLVRNGHGAGLHFDVYAVDSPDWPVAAIETPPSDWPEGAAATLDGVVAWFERCLALAERVDASSIQDRLERAITAQHHHRCGYHVDLPCDHECKPSPSVELLQEIAELLSPGGPAAERASRAKLASEVTP